MCGIAGIYSFNKYKPNKHTLLKMINSIKHRGPDDSGIYVEDAVGLAHRRLSIIDVSFRAHQPMCNEDKRIWIVYNGEVYNYQALRIMLMKKGHNFISTSDTEVLIHLYEDKGIGMLNELNGMFAFALWDSNKKLLFCARDRFGVKPLYYTVCNGTFLFSSEIKSFLSFPGFSVSPNAEAIHEYLSFNYSLGDKTFFNNVNVLPPASYIIIKNGKTIRRTYWDIIYKTNWHISYADALHTLSGLFSQSVKRQLVSDVPVGSYLSGGMDSSAIATVAAQQIPSINTFTCGFNVRGLNDDDTACDERHSARIVSKTIGSIHHEYVVQRCDLKKYLGNILWHLDEPKAGISYPPFLIAREAAKHVKVVLAGHGGDEYFGGYPWRHRLGIGMRSMREFCRCYFDAVSFIIPYRDSSEAYTRRFIKQVDPPSLFSRFKQELAAVKAEQFVDKALGFDARHFLTALLTVEDKLGMAHSLETRVPFLDNELIDYVLQLPYYYKITPDAHKILLKDTLKQYLPPEICERQKVGFGPPDNAWYRMDLAPFIVKTLDNRKARLYNFLKKDYVMHILHNHLKGKGNHRRQLWSFLCLEYWYRIFVEGEKM